MTDRVSSLLVVLEKDVRTDDVQALVDAIGQLRNVLSVGTNVSDWQTHTAQERVRQELGEKLWSVLYDRK